MLVESQCQALRQAPGKQRQTKFPAWAGISGPPRCGKRHGRP